MSRIIIIGGCRSGKSWLAREYRRRGVPTFCGDPLSTVKEPDPLVNYLPEGLDFSGNEGGPAWIADNWFGKRGSWVCEGHCMARALRRWLKRHEGHYEFDFSRPDRRIVPIMPCDRIIVLHGTRPECGQLLPGQLSLNKGVFTVWNQIKHHFNEITEDRKAGE